MVKNGGSKISKCCDGDFKRFFFDFEDAFPKDLW